jgi:Basic region leucine zipper
MPVGGKHMNYPLPEPILPYSAAPIYPSVPYQIDETGHVPQNYTPSDVSSSISPPNGQFGNSKYSSAPPGDRIASALSLEEQSRRAAEEDKRRRNTAASARFRVKKKQRELELERTVRDATELNATLEARVAQLEMENRWLKNLLTEKNENLASRIVPPPENSIPLQQPVQSSRSTQKPIQPKRDVDVGMDV